MLYGDEYGELIGDAIADIETHVEDGLARLAYALNNADDFKKMLTIFLERSQALENAIRGVTPTLLFDLDNAYGAQLDQLGNILVCPREGWDDDVYRVYLQTQSLLILPDRRTQSRLMAVVRSLMNSPAGTIDYQEYRAKGYLVGVTGVPLSDLHFWNRRFLERCRPATYNTQTIWHPEGAFGYDDAVASVTTTVEGYSDATNTVVDIGGPYSAVV